MSGGVDSSVAAYLLKNAGHEVAGFTAKMFQSPQSEDAVQRAALVCERLGIEHHVVDVSGVFREEIIDPFCRAYLEGNTPSPCIRCNRLIKFGELFDFACSHGYGKIATGHFVKIETDGRRHWLRSSQSFQKDQSYFLFYLTQRQLSGALFILGDAEKETVREIARTAQLPVSEVPDSQEICFVPDDDYRSYLAGAGFHGEKGWIIDTHGKKLGEHEGIHNYTIGQRRGLGVSYPEALYVVDINVEENLIITGTRDKCARRGLIASDINYMKAESLDNVHARVKIRSTHTGQGARCSEREGKLEIIFDEPALNISPGQAAVLYDDSGAVLGGGWIERVID